MSGGWKKQRLLVRAGGLAKIILGKDKKGGEKILAEGLEKSELWQTVVEQWIKMLPVVT